jgi:alkyldihydroxyacetonephosphate synthase
VKFAIQQTFVDSGATLSHHHAVGVEHAEWLEQDVSPAGVALLRALFDGIDPGGNLNPGKIVGRSSSPAGPAARPAEVGAAGDGPAQQLSNAARE